ncbi:histone-lysine N-methyltransferase ATXR4 [Physcomitrium patens]|uniref:SET domain-containing protein n=1 Tax=Physcomitrium patens TaxID=3218 RepID=A9T182_PHYPA|nr:histone-lysine N-methyltransferase ATXR4-like isoform X2 [Physcomitrium patens]PNR26601.1 hypothetical protein PHYPA_030082 [Physcomitrium patens]|eukprot:XP_024366271.1 histone-lysine N-methyltransferase ATXR4-like isoform X2 [Physcomitrella patens]
MRPFRIGSLYFLRRCSTHVQGLPIRVGHTLDAGRGVYAIRNIAHGELIHTADPVVAHPSIASLDKACYFCLKGLKRSVSYGRLPASEGSPTYCDRTCEESAQMLFYAAERQVDWSEFHDYCSTYGVRFPLIAKRLACMVASSRTSPKSLDILSHVDLSHGIPDNWITERKLLFKAISSKEARGLNLEFLTDDWYAGVLARLHINAFRIERIEEADSEDILAAAAASIMGESIVGSAVYILPSMYNHNCDPNVDILWPSNATANLVARRSIKSGEELHITYIDSSMSLDERRSFLEQHYGFTCRCARCRDGD